MNDRAQRLYDILLVLSVVLSIVAVVINFMEG